MLLILKRFADISLVSARYQHFNFAAGDLEDFLAKSRSIGTFVNPINHDIDFVREGQLGNGNDECPSKLRIRVMAMMIVELFHELDYSRPSDNPQFLEKLSKDIAKNISCFCLRGHVAIPVAVEPCQPRSDCGIGSEMIPKVINYRGPKK